MSNITFTMNHEGQEITTDLNQITITNSYYSYIGLYVRLSNLEKHTKIKHARLKLHMERKVNATDLKLYYDGVAVDTFKQIDLYTMEIDLAKLLFRKPENEDIYFYIKANSTYNFYTLHHTNELLRPSLSIEAVPQMLANQEKFTQGVGAAGGYELNLVNGNFSFIKSLISGTGNTLPLDLSLHFDTNYPDETGVLGVDFGLPNGWKTNYHQYVWEEGDYNYFYLDGMGKYHKFTQAENASSVYYDEAQTGLILTVVGDTKRIENSSNITLVFGERGLLTRVEEKVSNTQVNAIIINHGDDNKILDITDGMGRSYAFTYQENSIIISTPLGNNYILHKNTNNQLYKITEPTTLESTYTYDIDGKILTAQSDNGEKLTITYDDFWCPISLIHSVNKTSDSVYESYSVTYKNLCTVVKNYHNVEYAYFYNLLGQTTGCSELKTDSDTTHKYLLDDGVERLKGVIDDNNYLEYMFSGDKEVNVSGDLSNKQTVSNDSTLPNGTFSFELGKKYILAVTYSMSKKTENIASIVKLSGYSTGQVVIMPSLDYQRTDCAFIEAVNSTIPTITIEHLSDADLQIEHVRLYEYTAPEVITYLNAYTGKPALNISGLTQWYKMGYLEYFQYGDDLTTINCKMTYSDLIENLRLQALGKNYVWYDDKTKLLCNPGDVILTFEVNPPVSLSDLKLGILQKQGNIMNFITSEYSPTSITNFLITKEYIIHNDSYYLNKYVFNKYNLMMSSEDYNGVCETNVYDSFGNLTTKIINNLTNSLILKTEYDYVNKNLTTIKEYEPSKTLTTTITYNDDGDILSVTKPNGQVINYTYDGLSRMKEMSSIISSVTNKNQITYTKDLVTKLTHNSLDFDYSYNALNMISNVKIGSSTVLTNRYSKNSIGDNALTTYSNGFNRLVRYDKYGRNIVVEEGTTTLNVTPVIVNYYDKTISGETPSDQTSDLYQTNRTNKLQKQKDLIINDEESYSYNKYDQLTAINHTSNTYNPALETITYDSSNRLANKYVELNQDTNQRTTYIYTDNGNHPSEIVKEKTILQYQNNTGALTATFAKSVTFDELNRPSKTIISTDECELIKTYSYPSSNNISTTKPSQINYKYDTRDSSTSLGYDSYTYDATGAIVSSYMLKSGSPDIILNYTYDLNGRLTKETNTEMGTTELTYDAGGNILTKVKNGTTYTYTYDSVKKDRLINYNGQTLTYDNIGNPLTFGSTSFTWTRGSMLNSLTKSGTTYRYLYNAKGIRVKAYVSSTNYHEYQVEGDKILRETYQNTSAGIAYDLNFIYAGNEVIGFVYDGEKYIYRKNLQNDIMEIYKEGSATPVAKYWYDAWGNHKVCNSDGSINTSSTFIGNINPFRYRGYYYDKETGLFLLSSRYYSPELCRFIQPADVLGLNPSRINGLNLYSYANINLISVVKFIGKSYISITNGFNQINFDSNFNLPILSVRPKHGNYWDPHVKGEWFDTDYPTLFSLSNDGFEIVSWNLSVYKGSLYFDHNEKHSLYVSFGNIGLFAGFVFPKDSSKDNKTRFGFDASANVIEIGYDGRIIDASVSGLSIGATYLLKDGKFKLEHGYGSWGWSVSIDFIELFKLLFRGALLLRKSIE